MTSRPIFFIDELSDFVKTVSVPFVWFPGFSESQKRKSINSLHASAKKVKPNFHILEVSSKSENKVGISLSAFNLKYKKRNGMVIPLESAFQGSKIFEEIGQVSQLYNLDPRSAKSEARNCHNKFKLIGFKLDEIVYPMYPKTIFYDWLYIQSVLTSIADFSVFNDYNAFSDIEFNPVKSINCQAFSLALITLMLRTMDPLEVLDININDLKKKYPSA